MKMMETAIDSTQTTKQPTITRSFTIDYWNVSQQKSITSDGAYRILFNLEQAEYFTINNGHTIGKGTCEQKKVIAILNHNEQYELAVSKPTSLFILSIEEQFLTAWTGSVNRFTLSPQDAMMDELMTKLYTQKNRKDFGGTRLIEGFALTITNHLYCNFATSGKKIFAPKAKLSPQQMYQLIEFVKRSLHGEVHLADMANEAHLSEFHFSRLFRSTFGISPYQFVLQMKVECAQQIMRSYPKSLSQIAHSLHFTDQAHFTNVFKKYTGVCPTQFLNLKRISRANVSYAGNSTHERSTLTERRS
jgi:AraC-like DNA-binding protein